MNKSGRLVFLLFIPFFSLAQENTDTLIITDQRNNNLDSLRENAELILTDTATDRPNIAAIYSAVLPGLGQVYNKKYWKLPIVYGGFVFFGYLMKYNHEVYKETHAALYALEDGDNRTSPNPPYDRLSQNVLERGNDFYRRNRDFVIILTVVWYALNVVDAHVDGHLNEFRISDDLSLNLRPSVEPVFFTRNYGVTLTLNF